MSDAFGVGCSTANTAPSHRGATVVRRMTHPLSKADLTQLDPAEPMLIVTMAIAPESGLVVGHPDSGVGHGHAFLDHFMPVGLSYQGGDRNTFERGHQASLVP